MLRIRLYSQSGPMSAGVAWVAGAAAGRAAVGEGRVAGLILSGPCQRNVPDLRRAWPRSCPVVWMVSRPSLMSTDATWSYRSTL